MPSLWTESYRKHFQKQFQKPFDIQVFNDRDGFALKLATHDLAGNGYRVYASMGLADKLAQNEEDDFGEVILYADVSDQEVPRLFVNALFFILHNDIPLGSRFAIGGIDEMRPEFAKRYSKTALYFTRAASNDDEPPDEALKEAPLGTGHKDTINKVRNGEEFGWVYQAYFITAEEEEYLEEVGADAFEEKLAAQAGDRLSLRRETCV